MTKIPSVWKQFTNFQDALKRFKGVSCIYMLTDKDGRILRIGESGNLRSRYRGGTGWMVEVALHGSGNMIFVATAPIVDQLRKSVEALLIFKCQPPYCQQNKLVAPTEALEIENEGELPRGMV